MKVFISFSGEKSKRAAKVLNEWLPDVIQAVVPFLSDEIAKGARPAQEIWGSLVDAEYGILCLTRDNLQRPWINYEAGALAHKLAPESGSDASTDIPVTGFLVDVESPTEVKGPLGYFQHTRFSEAEFRKLMRSINQRLPDESRLSESRLERAFDMHWEAFRDKIQEINDDESLRSGEEQSQRTDRDLLEEILELARAQSRGDRRLADNISKHNYRTINPFITEEMRAELDQIFHNNFSEIYPLSDVSDKLRKLGQAVSEKTKADRRLANQREEDTE